MSHDHSRLCPPPCSQRILSRSTRCLLSCQARGPQQGRILQRCRAIRPLSLEGAEQQPNNPTATGTADQTAALAHPGGCGDAQPGSSVAGSASESRWMKSGGRVRRCKPARGKRNRGAVVNVHRAPIFQIKSRLSEADQDRRPATVEGIVAHFSFKRPTNTIGDINNGTQAGLDAGG